MRTYLRKTWMILLFAAGLIHGNRACAQLVVLPEDTTICPNTSVTLNASVGSGTLTPVVFSQPDDYFSAVMPIGFSFNYFGNNYSNCIISENGYIKFNTAQASQGSPWVIPATGAIPGNGDVFNSIMGFYADIYPFTAPAGTISAATLGVAPNRKFVVAFCDCPMFSCTSLKASFQIIIYETTNDIEVHIANAPNCPTWNGGFAIEGIQDNTGTIAFPVPGRNVPTQWTAFHSSHRWTPTSTTNYTLTPITYAPVPDVGSTINWYANGATFIGAGNTITVTPTTNTFYVAEVTKCGDTIRDTSFVTMGGGPSIDSLSFTDPTACGTATGTITLYGLDPNQAYSLHYSYNGAQQTPLGVTSNINGVVTMVNLPAGAYDSLIIFKGLCFSNKMGPVILTDPPVVSAFVYDIHFGCNGDTAIFTNNSIQNTFNIWDFGDGSGDTALNPVHIYPLQGVYNVKLVVSNGYCKDSSIQQISTLHPLAASFTVDDDSACTNQQLTFTNTSTATNPIYFWDFGDSSTATIANPVHTYLNPGTYTVMMVVGDLVPCFDTAYMDILVDTIPTVSFVVSDSVLCEGQGIVFTGEFLQTGNTGVVWNFGDATFTFDKSTAVHAFDSSGTYNVTLTASYRNCPDADFTRSVLINPFPMVDLGPDTTMCPNGEAIILRDYKNMSLPGAVWHWNTGDSVSQIAVRHPGIYTVRVALAGCANSDSIEVFKDCYIDIPNSFTPNGDGINDYFLPRQLLSQGVTGFKMIIYNRWGQEIFQTVRIDGRGWDGKFNEKDQPNGVYVYMMDVILKSGAHEHYQGNVTLLR